MAHLEIVRCSAPLDYLSRDECSVDLGSLLTRGVGVLAQLTRQLAGSSGVDAGALRETGSGRSDSLSVFLLRKTDLQQEPGDRAIHRDIDAGELTTKANRYRHRVRDFGRPATLQ